MITRRIPLAAAALAGLLCLQQPVWADNAMGYRLLSVQEAAGLPHNRGALGMDIGRASQITAGGMTFDIMRIKQVRPGSAGAQAGFRAGDMIIAVDGRVFPTIAAFAAYVGSVPPGNQVNVDYIPAGGGPDTAERVAVTVGAAGAGAQAPAQAQQPAPAGMSTRTKIGLGAAALLACYEMGCFSSGSRGAAGAQQRR
ncbi:MAG: PDZ domain-containing protein [Alphaproteobacteria bacterium]|nr:PDZ domain-containing protein [Alphaproteobacteria bacterium]MBV9862236.1 PDZ domain-containing protein [Alphaproteobacteria bacterium]